VRAAGARRGAGFLGQRGDRQGAPGCPLEDLGGLLQRARIELDEQMHDDPVVVLMLVKAHVGEEFTYAVIAERGVGESVARLRARAGLDVIGIDGDRARGDPRGSGDHPLPAILDGLDASVLEAEMRLIVHAVKALHDGLLELVDDLGSLTGLGIDLVDALVVHLHLEILGPAAVATQPAARSRLRRRSFHGSHSMLSRWPARTSSPAPPWASCWPGGPAAAWARRSPVPRSPGGHSCTGPGMF
jgi:hypothetical protein